LVVEEAQLDSSARSEKIAKFVPIRRRSRRGDTSSGPELDAVVHADTLRQL
jgi:hypothetical protein